jgi:hypothetical protein
MNAKGKDPNEGMSNMAMGHTAILQSFDRLTMLSEVETFAF